MRVTCLPADDQRAEAAVGPGPGDDARRRVGGSDQPGQPDPLHREAGQPQAEAGHRAAGAAEGEAHRLFRRHRRRLGGGAAGAGLAPEDRACRLCHCCPRWRPGAGLRSSAKPVEKA
jgi:hypothetical protein